MAYKVVMHAWTEPGYSFAQSYTSGPFSLATDAESALIVALQTGRFSHGEIKREDEEIEE